MVKLFGVIRKEFLILIRDIPALLFLFILPTILLVVISSAEDKMSKQNMLTVLLIGPDSSEIKMDIKKAFQESHFFKVKNITSYDSISIQAAKESIASGKYQAGIFVKPDASKILATEVEQIVESYFTNAETERDSLKNNKHKAVITVFFDPAIKGYLKYSLIGSLNGTFRSIEINALLKEYFTNLKKDIRFQFSSQLSSLKNRNLSEAMPDFMFKDTIIQKFNKSLEDFAKEELTISLPEFPWKSQNLIALNEEYAGEEQNRAVIKPTVTQTSVPGFTLFAMFFIVVPLTGSIITERNEGAFARLRTLPVSYLTLMFGKIAVYIMVCMLQFVFLFLIGMFVLPAITDIPALVIGSNYIGIFITSVVSALAAIGFGLLIGTWARSHAQAGALGSLLVVIMGILGGVFIPVYLMPDLVKTIGVISPLRWGIDSFIDLFVRDEGLSAVFINIAKLFLFFAVALALAIYHYSRRK